MRTLRLTILLLIIISAGCQKKLPGEQKRTTAMAIDSVMKDKNATIVRPNDKLRPEESTKELKDNPQIMQLDLEASQNKSSKEIHYVKVGDKISPSEK